MSAGDEWIKKAAVTGFTATNKAKCFKYFVLVATWSTASLQWLKKTMNGERHSTAEKRRRSERPYVVRQHVATVLYQATSGQTSKNFTRVTFQAIYQRQCEE
jgi:hypothetical protein